MYVCVCVCVCVRARAHAPLCLSWFHAIYTFVGYSIPVPSEKNNMRVSI